MKNINVKQNKTQNDLIKKINLLSNLLLLPLIFFSLLTFIVSEANFPLNDQQCNQVINNTYYNLSARNAATIYNTQVCLSRAGFFNNNGKFTTNYGPVTRQASDNYIAYIKDQEVKAQEKVVPTPAPQPIKTETPPPVISQPEEKIISNVPKPNTEALNNNRNNNQNEVVKADGIGNNTDNTTTKPTLSQTNEEKEIAKIDQTNQNKQEGSKPLLFQEFLFNSLYFVFALPFILFAVSIALAFKKVYKKNGLKKF